MDTLAFADAGSEPLADLGTLAEATDEPMYVAGKVLWRGGNGAEAGLWRCTAGESRWSLGTNEFVHIIEGSMTVTRDGGTPIKVGPGADLFFETGWTGTWSIHAELLKSYVVF